MALPNKTFWVNYNARNYNSTTLTIPKENGQLFNEDLVLPGSVTFTDDHIAITGDKRIHFTFNNTADNIFNRTINTANVTIIAKVSPTNSTWFFSNRDGSPASQVGYLVALGRKYNFAFLDNYSYTTSTSPMIFTWRCGNGDIQYIAHSDNVVGTPYQSTDWARGEMKNIYFFGGNTSSEIWNGDFYWLYMSPETLTDAEIQQVIVYNDHLHTFSIDKSNARFAASGGTETVEIEAETTWTASTPSFVSVSPSTGDTGTTQVTITCPSYTGATRREDVITFTDNDDYTLTFKARQNGNSAGFSNIYLGDNNLLSNTIFLGDNAVNTTYLGDEIIYSNGPFVGLKVAPQSLALNNTINTANITIRSSENWTITDDSGGWLSYSTTTGGTGKTVVTVTASTTQADRTATITVTSANYSANIGVSQKLIDFVDYVYVDARDNQYVFIDTGIYPTTATTFRVKLKVIEGNGGCVVGFAPPGGGTPRTSSSDSDDYRYIDNNGEHSAWFDFNSGRIQNRYVETDANGMNDITFGNYYIQDNLTGSIVGTATTQSSMATTTVPIYLSISNRERMQSLEIYDGQTLVFNGHAALLDGVYGIYDSVTGTLLQPYQQQYTVLGGYF